MRLNCLSRVSLDEACDVILIALTETEDEELNGILMEAVAINSPSAQELKYYAPEEFIHQIKEHYEII